MPLDRSELIARSLLHANQITGGGVSLPAMVDNPHFSKLTPEEKADIVGQYADLTRGGVSSQPSLLSAIGSGAKHGLVTSILPTALAGVVAVPTVAALTASFGKKVPMLNIAERVVAPLALAGAIGVGAGIAGSLIGRVQSQENNRYLSRILDSIRQEQDPDTRAIKSMALVAASPTLNRRGQALEQYGNALSGSLIGHYINPRGETKKMFNQILPEYEVQIPGNNKPMSYDYKDFSFVKGLDTLTTHPAGSNPKYKIVPNGE